MANPVKTRPYDTGDVFIREDMSRAWNSTEVAYANGGTTVVTLETGCPMVAAVPATAAEVTTGGVVTSVVLRTQKVQPGETRKIAVLNNGTGMVANSSMFPVNDIAGPDPFGAGELALDYALLGFKVIAEPTKVTVQDS
jgi:hypothetical protein